MRRLPTILLLAALAVQARAEPGPSAQVSQETSASQEPAQARHAPAKAAPGPRAKPAPAQPGRVQPEQSKPAQVWVSDHDGFGRVVVDLGQPASYRLARDGDHVTLLFDGKPLIGSPSGVPRNVQSIVGGTGRADIVIAHGASLRDWRRGGLVVIEVLDPRQQAHPPASPPPASPAPSGPVAAVPHSPVEGPGTSAVGGTHQMPVAAAASPAAAAKTAAGAAVAKSGPPPAARPADPPPLAASPTPQSGDAPAFTLSFGPSVGAAAFRRGGSTVVVFDQRRTVDLGALRGDPVFGAATAETVAAGTVIRMPLADGMALSLSRDGAAWRIAAVPAPLRISAIEPQADGGKLTFPAKSPGEVLSIADPDTGGVLLVGTERAPGEGVTAPRRTPEFSLPPTWQGVVVDPLSDALDLRVKPDGFQLTGGKDGLSLSTLPEPGAALANADALTRVFDLPALAPDALARRMQSEVAAAAAAPAMGRGPLRLASAQTMIALGLGPEAQAVLQAAAAQDPALAASPVVQALTAVAALVSGRTDEAQALLAPAVDGSDEIALWRAVLAADRQDGAPQAAAGFAATLPLILSYPDRLRSMLLPLAAETMAAGGETKAAAALLDHREADPSLALARAMLKEAQGDTAGALAAYDAVAAGSDRFRHARAAVRAVELRLAAHTMDAGQAADALDKLLYAWRGGTFETSLRQRVAELREQTGEWRTALALLRENEASDPDRQQALHARLQAAFNDMAGGKALDGLSALDLVALIGENADLLPGGPDGQALDARLADRLMALDLPKRAAPVLEKLMKQAAGGGRAELGARLAALRLGEGDADGALAALSASAGPDLPPGLAERRGLVQAAAESKRGDRERSLATLAAIGTSAADEARAAELERADDWHGAAQALAGYAARTVPASGKLDDAQRATLLRLATAEARSGDAAALASLRASVGARMESGPLADMFRLLTADPVHGVGDIGRAGRETGLARALPQQLNAVTGTPRL